MGLNLSVRGNVAFNGKYFPLEMVKPNFNIWNISQKA